MPYAPSRRDRALSLVVTRYIAHERQQLDLFMNCNSFVLFSPRRLEVTQGHPFEAAASGDDEPR